MFPVSKNVLLMIAAIIGAVLLFNLMNETTAITNRVPFSEFLSQVENGKLHEVTLKGEYAYGIVNNQIQFVTIIPKYYKKLIPFLYGKGMAIKVEPLESNSLFFAILSSWLPIILIIGVWLFFMKQMQGGNKAMGFGKAKTRMLDQDNNQITFKDVAGIDESKTELDEIVEFLRDPSKFEKLGGKIPTGVLLVGAPGTGKTLLAKAVAGEASASFFSITGSDFVEMFVGVGAARVRDLFAQAKANVPCIVFVDEIDAVGRQRGAGLGGGHDEREQTLNQLLVEMDGFNGNEGVIIIAATNRPDVLDPALTRPGRFDRQVVVPLPDVNGREKILEIHTRDIDIASDIDLKVIAKATPGFSGADLANLANEAALLAARANKTKVEMSDFESARDKVMMGAERHSLVISKKEKETTAYHEAGHAIIAELIEEVDPVHKVSIIPRGRALGVTSLLPDEEKFSQRLSQINGMLTMMLGGRAAEEIVFNHFTTGASNDIERATHIAHSMVCNWGMSEKIGPIYLAANQGEIFLGRDMMRRKRISQSLAREIDSEVDHIIKTAYSRALNLLKANVKVLHAISKNLIEKETLDGSTIREFLNEQTATV